MSIDQIRWTQGCCGSACSVAEVKVTRGYLRVTKDAKGVFRVTEFGLDKMLVRAERPVSESELVALLA